MGLLPSDSALLSAHLPAPLTQRLADPDVSEGELGEACALLEAQLAALIPFTPSLVVDLQLANPERGGVAGLYADGTAMLVDLSGLWRLSGQLAAAGRQGSEEVSAIANRLFAVLVAEIGARGGGVVKFAGDTLIAFFPAQQLKDYHAALAGAAALAMQAQLDSIGAIPTSRGAFQPSLRVAVHSGRVFAAEVGDRDHTELLLTGYTINHLMQVLLSVAPGEVVISDKTLHALGGGATVRQKLAGRFQLIGLAEEPPSLWQAAPRWQPGPPSLATAVELARRVDVLQSYVPHRLPPRFVQSGGGEFRPVTVLCTNLYTLRNLLSLLELPALIEDDPSIIGQVLNTYYLRMQQLIHHYGGGVSRIDMALAGDRLTALFGAPAAHEDDPARAVQAALAIRDALPETNQAIVALLERWAEAHPKHRQLLRMLSIVPNQRGALASGTVFAGVVGPPERHEYAAIGATVHLAARVLESAADGEVLLASATNRAVRHLVDVQTLASLTLPGFARPVPVFRALQLRTDADRLVRLRQRSARLIGRGAELAQLDSWARQALRRTPAGGVAVIAGDAGVGKSRLASEALQQLQEAVPGATIARETCQSYEQTTAYAVAGRLLGHILRPTPPADRDRKAQAAAVLQQLEALAPAWSRFGPLLAPLLNLPIEESELTLALTPEQRRDRLHDLFVAVCGAYAERQPLVLVIDDLHWIDESSRVLIERLAAELPGRPLLLLLIYRPAPEFAEPWRVLPHSRTITLRELARQDSEALLSALLDGPLPAELQPLIARAHDTPLFLEETVRFLVESGALTRDARGAWVCARPIDPGTVPTRVEQLIVARLDRLDEESRSVLQLAAVIGGRFSIDLLAAALRGDGWRLRLGALVDAALLALDERAPHDTYRFRHAIIRDVVYESMLFARRRELHAEVAAAIERVYADDIAAHCVVLAQHYQRAEMPDKAFPYFLAAAHAAQARYANGEALALYEQVLATAPWREQPAGAADSAAIDVYERMGDVLALTGAYDRARGIYGWPLRLLEERPPIAQAHVVRRAALQRKIGSTYENQGSLDLALDWLTRAVLTIASSPMEADAVLEHARILSDLGWLHFRRNDLEEARSQLEQALSLITPLAAYAEQASILNRLGGVAWQGGDVAMAQRYVEQGLAASERSGNLVDQANALNNLGVLTESRGLIDDSIRYGRQAIENYERSGNRRGVAIAMNTVGYAFYDCEDYEQAREYFARAFEIAVEARDIYHQMLVLLNMGRVYAALRRWDEAERSVVQSHFLALQLHLPSVQLEGHVVLGEIALGRGDLAAAMREYEHGQRLVGSVDGEEEGKFQRFAAALALAQGDAARAGELLAATEALFTHLQNVPEIERTRRLRADLMALDA